MLPAFIILVGQVLEMQKAKRWRFAKAYYCIAAVLAAVLVLNKSFGGADLSWIRMVTKVERVSIWAVSTLVFLAFLYRKEFRLK